MSKDGLLLEDLDSKMDAVLEAVGQMRQDMNTKLATKEDLAEVKADIKVIKAAVTDLSDTVEDHETRITNLEAV